MTLNVQLTEEEALCLHRYFERVDQTEDLSFVHPAEYLALQRIAGQIFKASTAVLKSNYEKLVELARHSVVRGLAGEARSSEKAHDASEPILLAAARTRGAQARAANRASGAVVGSPSRVEAVARACIDAFDAGDIEAAVAQFSIDARIVSPHLGCATVRKFVGEVVRRSGGARLTLHGLRTNIEGRPQAVGYFLYERWQKSSREESAAEAQGVFNYVLNIDPAAGRVQSMLIL